MVDLEHEGHLGNVDGVQRFPNEAALKGYSQRTGRLYQRASVPGKSLLKSLQRNLPDPRPEQTHMDNRKKKGGKQGGGVSNQSLQVGRR